MRRLPFELLALLLVTGCCCTTARTLRSGQTQCDQGDGILAACPGSPAGQDASLSKGVERSYTDNGDGTITDNATALVWEKLDDNNAGGIHDDSTAYSWEDAIKVKIAALNTAKFAGHDDWRLPNIVELQSLLDYNEPDLRISPIFKTGCVPNCTIAVCSCTVAPGGGQPEYWSSSHYIESPALAWWVRFSQGFISAASKSMKMRVRAVRGGCD